MPTRAVLNLPIELVRLTLMHAVRHYLVEHPATAIAIACVSRGVYDLVRPTLYHSFIGPRLENSEDSVRLDIDTLSKPNQFLVQRLFVTPFATDVSGLDLLVNTVELHASWELLVNTLELYVSWELLRPHGRMWADNIVRAVLRAPLGDIAQTLGMDSRFLGDVFPSLTHLTLLAVSPRAGNMMGYAIERILGWLKRLTHFGLDMGDDAYLLLGTGAKDKITNHGLKQDQYAINAVISLQAALEFGPDSEVVPHEIRAALGYELDPSRKCLDRVALRVPEAYMSLWELHMFPRIVQFMKDAASSKDLEVADRLWVWCETRVCNNFTEKMTALRRDFLAETDLWSESIPFRVLLTDNERA